MRPEYRRVNTRPAQSFSVRRDDVPDINNRWHYHHETELIHFHKGSGTHFIGDSIRRFNSGDIVLIGSNLPHFTRFDENFFQDTAPDIRVVHFNENLWGNEFINLPENKGMKTLLEKGKRGLLITGETKATVAAMIEAMLQTEGQEKLILLMQVLNKIATNEQAIPLSSISFNNDFGDAEKDRISDIYDYTLNNFNKKIYIEDIAAIAKISPNSFCRYFKSRTRKTYSQFLLEIKVGQACKLLLENKLNLKQICYESGFNNFVSFHRYFKQITGKSPAAYQKEFGVKSNK